MGTHVLTDAVLTINSVNLSAWCKSASIDYEAESVDETAMGDTTRSHIGGLKNWTLTAELMQDYASSAVDQTLWSLIGTTTAIKLKATSSSNGATNPEYQGTGLVTAYKPVGGAIGDLHTTQITIVSAGTLTRATS